MRISWVIESFEKKQKDKDEKNSRGGSNLVIN